MIASVTSRHRTDRHGGMIERVRGYLAEHGGRREKRTSVERPEAEYWESVADVQDYVHAIEGIAAGVAVSAYHLTEYRRRYHVAVARLEARPAQHVRSYASAAGVYVLALERVVAGEDVHRSLHDVLRRNYQQRYETVCRSGV